MSVIHRLTVAVLFVCLSVMFAVIALGIGMRLPHLFDLLPLLLGLAAGYAGRTWLRGQRGRALGLIATTLLSAWCLQCFRAGILLASMMGLPLSYTLAQAGLALLNHLAYMATSTLFIITSLCGCLIAVRLGLRRAG